MCSFTLVWLFCGVIAACLTSRVYINDQLKTTGALTFGEAIYVFGILVPGLLLLGCFSLLVVLIVGLGDRSLYSKKKIVESPITEYRLIFNTCFRNSNGAKKLPPKITRLLS